MKKLDLAGMTRSAQMGLKKHSPELLTGLGIAGMISTTVLAVKATPKALDLIDEEKLRINREIRDAAHEEDLEVYSPIEKLKPVDVVKTVWKCYIPAAVTGTASILCLVGASSVSTRRNAALATAYALSESTLKTYREKVVETIGEKKEATVREAVAKEHIEQNPVTKNEIVLTGKGETLCYDAISGRYFKSDIEKIRKGLNDANYELNSQLYVSLNDFYNYIGLDDTKIGRYLGWNISKGTIELDFNSQLTNDGTPCLVLDYQNMPYYDFDMFM